MTPLHLFEYMAAFAGGLLPIGGVSLLLLAFYGYLRAPAKRPPDNR